MKRILLSVVLAIAALYTLGATQMRDAATQVAEQAARDRQTREATAWRELDDKGRYMTNFDGITK